MAKLCLYSSLETTSKFGVRLYECHIEADVSPIRMERRGAFYVQVQLYGKLCCRPKPTIYLLHARVLWRQNNSLHFP